MTRLVSSWKVLLALPIIALSGFVQDVTGADCPTEGFFAVPGDCTRFYRCVRSSAGPFQVFHFNCPPGTLFDSFVNVCNHPWAVRQPCREAGSGVGDKVDQDASETSNLVTGSGSQGPTSTSKPARPPSKPRPTKRPTAPVNRPTKAPPSKPRPTPRPPSKPRPIATNRPTVTVRPTQRPIVTIRPTQRPIATIRPTKRPIDTIRPIAPARPTKRPSTPVKPGQRPSAPISPTQSPIETVRPPVTIKPSLPLTSTRPPFIQPTQAPASSSSVGILPGQTNRPSFGQSPGSFPPVPASTTIVSTLPDLTVTSPDLTLVTTQGPFGQSERPLPGQTNRPPFGQTTLSPFGQPSGQPGQSNRPPFGQSPGGFPAVPAITTAVPTSPDLTGGPGSDIDNQSTLGGSGDSSNGISNNGQSETDEIGDNSIPAGQGSDNEIEDSLTGGGGGGGQENEFQVLPGSLFNCPAPGFYPFETNCKEFYVCLEVLPNVLAAEQLYRCPDRYLFDEKKRRCLREEKVNCTRFEVDTFSILGKTNVLVVMERFLNQFFTTPLTYNRQL